MMKSSSNHRLGTIFLNKAVIVFERGAFQIPVSLMVFLPDECWPTAPVVHNVFFALRILLLLAAKCAVLHQHPTNLERVKAFIPS